MGNSLLYLHAQNEIIPFYIQMMFVPICSQVGFHIFIFQITQKIRISKIRNDTLQTETQSSHFAIYSFASYASTQRRVTFFFWFRICTLVLQFELTD
ncbi:hypothetical protein DLM75_17070 [Leptospira stimsonii]|uniref:Uncharacterized protein n=1 Tax=Leptospira stimsonii TaxID=2202203 RepID=A0A396Z221_9LEPT|nr:hypothetical protein DLM75_17070 [Leptospira stimsonii]